MQKKETNRRNDVKRVFLRHLWSLRQSEKLEKLISRMPEGLKT